MNLLVAKGIPSLAHLDIGRYQRVRDEWADGVRKRIPYAEKVFAGQAEAWQNDVNCLRLTVLHGYIDGELGMRYIEEQLEVKEILYTNPSDTCTFQLTAPRRPAGSRPER